MTHNITGKCDSTSEGAKIMKRRSALSRFSRKIRRGLQTKREKRRGAKGRFKKQGKFDERRTGITGNKSWRKAE